MTRFWFAISLGFTGSEGWLKETVLDAQEVVPDEIWCLTIITTPKSSTKSKTETVYVLEATCEVVGHPPESREASETPSPARPLRADWSAYIQKHLSSKELTNAATPSILSQLKWANYEEYDKGVSRLWLRRTASEGTLGAAKRTVAHRYVLACVTANRSVLGRTRMPDVL